jgi:hypothetical protein
LRIIRDAREKRPARIIRVRQKKPIDLRNVGNALRPAQVALHRSKRRACQGDEHRRNRKDDEQFDDGECAAPIPDPEPSIALALLAQYFVLV